MTTAPSPTTFPPTRTPVQLKFSPRWTLTFWPGLKVSITLLVMIDALIAEKNLRTIEDQGKLIGFADFANDPFEILENILHHLALF